MQQSTGDGQLSSKSDGTTELKLDKMAVIARGMYEYAAMFNLEKDGVIQRLLDSPGARVLDMPGSTSTFGFQLRRMAERAGADLKVFSADIVYDVPAADLYAAAVRTAKEALAPLMIENTWVGQSWASLGSTFHTPADLLHYREVTYREWRKDFERQRDAGLYITDAFPTLEKLQGKEFDLIVSGNCLYAYADKLFGSNVDEIYQFHERSTLGLARLLSSAGELRIYPIGTASVPRYPGLDGIIDSLSAAGFVSHLDPVDPPNVKAWDRLLRVTRAG